MSLAREGKQQAWWQPYDLDYFATYVDLEQAATRLSYPMADLVLVIDEAVVHRVVGSPAVMAAQMQHLVAASAMPNVELQVISFEAGTHPAMDNIFTLLEFGQPAPAVVYVEGLLSWLCLEREQEVPGASKY
jgi:hypothetical protein